MLEEFENAEATYFSPTPKEGSLFKNPDLANTLERIAYVGRDEFYTGETAHRMTDYFTRIGGFLTYEDFASHQGEWVEPICVTYRDTAKLCELGPNTQGVAALQMLQMLEQFDLAEMGFGSADSIMAQVEAKRLAFADRARGYADPAFSGIDPRSFIQPDYAAELASNISLETPNPDLLGTLKAADAKLHDGDTTYLSVADENGMMVSLIQSNYRGMAPASSPMVWALCSRTGASCSASTRPIPMCLSRASGFPYDYSGLCLQKDVAACAADDTDCDYKPGFLSGLWAGGCSPGACSDHAEPD